MKFEFTDEQKAIRDAIAKLCAEFDAEYWLNCDTTGNFPEDFSKKICDGGWFGIAMPEEYGGSGLGITEASIMMQTIAESGAGFSGASAIHMNLFGLNPVVVFQEKLQLSPSVGMIIDN